MTERISIFAKHLAWGSVDNAMVSINQPKKRTVHHLIHSDTLNSTCCQILQLYQEGEYHHVNVTNQSHVMQYKTNKGRNIGWVHSKRDPEQVVCNQCRDQNVDNDNEVRLTKSSFALQRVPQPASS